MIDAEGPHSRGQLMIITALLLAVLFVGLALILNSAIYTENLSTREAGGSLEPLSSDVPTERRLTTSLAHANYNDETATYDERVTRVRSNVSRWGEMQRESSTRQGQLVSSELTAVENGTRVTQTNHGHFESANSSLLEADILNLSADTNWQAAPESERRAFRMTVQRDSLRETDPNLTTEITNLLDETLTGNDTFWTQFEADGSTYRMYLLDDSTNDSVAVVVTEYEDDDTEEVIGTCSAAAPDPSDNVTINVSAGTLYGADGETDCPALETASGDYGELYFVGADHVEGTYRFIADRPESEFRDALKDNYDTIISATLDTLLGGLTSDDIYKNDPADGEPYTTTAVYAVSVESTYADDRVTHTRNRTLAPVGR